MSRDLKDIKQQITASFINNEHIQSMYGIDGSKTFDQEFSLVSFENILFDLISYSIYLLELLFGQHKKQVSKELYNQKSGRLPWYRYMALKFQFGFDLITDTDEFNNIGYTGQQIEASKVIKYAAVVEGDKQGVVVVKIATEISGVLSPVSLAVKDSIESYFNEIRYAGTRVKIINYLPDLLSLNIAIYYDALVLDSNGVSIITGTKPVEIAIQQFMKELPFNGELILVNLIDKLQAVEGVKIPNLLEATSSWIDPITNSYGTPEVVSVRVIPVSGYFKVENFNNITYVV